MKGTNLFGDDWWGLTIVHGVSVRLRLSFHSEVYFEGDDESPFYRNEER